MITKTWNWKKAYARLIGNFLVSFGVPLTGAVAITQEYITSVYIALISASVTTMITAGRILDEWSTQQEEEEKKDDKE